MKEIKKKDIEIDRILLLTKKTEYCKEAIRIVKSKFDKVEVLSADFGNGLPRELDYIEKNTILISFLSPWIIPKQVLNQTKLAINFHPGTPSYGGFGYNFAIYNKEKEYGVTCHKMVKKVDSGEIIDIIYFPILETDTPFTLQQQTMTYALLLLKRVLGYIENGFPKCDIKWSRKPYTRKDFLKLCEIKLDMGKEEVDRRIKACYYPNAKDLPFIELNGHKFELKR